MEVLRDSLPESKSFFNSGSFGLPESKDVFKIVYISDSMHPRGMLKFREQLSRKNRLKKRQERLCKLFLDIVDIFTAL